MSRSLAELNHRVQAAEEERNGAVLVQLAEVLFGAAPQFCLQLYILGHYGEYDKGFLIALCLQGTVIQDTLIIGLKLLPCPTSSGVSE